MGLNDDEDPRVLMEFTITAPVVPQPSIQESSPQRKSQKAALPASPAKKSSYMDPIGKPKGAKAPVVPAQAIPQRTASPIKNQNLGKSPVRPPVTSKIVQPIKPKMNSPPRAPTITSSGKTYTPIQDISTILDQNPQKRQNVVFLKSLLDSQLQAL